MRQWWAPFSSGLEHVFNCRTFSTTLQGIATDSHHNSIFKTGGGGVRPPHNILKNLTAEQHGGNETLKNEIENCRMGGVDYGNEVHVEMFVDIDVTS